VRARFVEEAAGQVIATAREAVSTLRGLLISDNAGVRLRAVRSILDLALRMNEQVELESRVRRIEAVEPSRTP